MRASTKFAGLAAALTLGVAPALALGASHPNGRPIGVTTGPRNPNRSTHSHKCTPHKVAYIAYGKLTGAGWSATLDTADGKWDGPAEVNVTRTNHHARGAKGDHTFTLSDTTVRLGEGVTNPPANGDRVKVIGKITVLAKKCDQSSFTPAVTVRQVVVHQS